MQNQRNCSVSDSNIRHEYKVDRKRGEVILVTYVEYAAAEPMVARTATAEIFMVKLFQRAEL